MRPSSLVSQVPHGVVRRPLFMRALGLMPPYSIEDVKKAYRDEAARVHPDVGGDAEAFKALHTAYRQALEYAQFQDSRRMWLGSRVETYLARERVSVEIQSLGGRCQFGPVDAYLEEFGRDFAEVLRELIAIELAGPHIVDDSLSWIDSLGPVAGEVRTLSLKGTRISPEGLMRLEAFRSLRALDLRETPLSRKGLEVLATLPSLEWLHIGKTGLGFVDRRRIRRQYPRIEVVTKRSASPPPDSHWDQYLTVLRRLESL